MREGSKLKDWLRVLALPLIAASLALSACGGGKEGQPETPVATVIPTARATPTERRTGIPELDAVIDAVLARDAARLASLVRYKSIPCVAVRSVGGPPECPPGIAEGTAVDVLPITSCEGSYASPDSTTTVLQRVLEPDYSLYAVYRAPSSPEWGVPAEYVIVFSVWATPAREEGRVISVSDGHLVGFWDGCAQTAETIAAAYKDAILPPIPGPTPARSERRTGIEAVDAVVDAVVAGDVQRLRRFVRFTPVPCEANPAGIRAPPKCRPGEAEGTPVDVLPVAQCEGLYLRSDEVDTALRSLQSGNPTLYAVYLTSAEYWPPGDYVAIFSSNAPDLREVAEQLLITDGRLVGVVQGCGETPEQIVEADHFGHVVLPPP